MTDRSRMCKWCKEKSGPVIQLREGGKLHRWTWWYKGMRFSVPMTMCGYQLPEALVDR